jgi:hypothetical protein
MKMQDLERMDTSVIQKINSVSDLRRELAAKAAEKLGYSRMKLAMNTGRPLLAALIGLGITPFSQASVEEYKASKERTGIYSGTKEWIAILCASIVSAPLALFMWTRQFFLLGHMDAFQTVLYVAACVAVSITAVVFTLVTIFNADNLLGHGHRTVSSWETQWLNYFPGDIPDHVLSKALEIKESVPAAGLKIEYLSTRMEHNPAPAPDPDPFLVVSLDGESYYVDVWDEKKYEETL